MRAAARCLAGCAPGIPFVLRNLCTAPRLTHYICTRSVESESITHEQGRPLLGKEQGSSATPTHAHAGGHAWHEEGISHSRKGK